MSRRIFVEFPTLNPFEGETESLITAIPLDDIGPIRGAREETIISTLHGEQYTIAEPIEKVLLRIEEAGRVDETRINRPMADDFRSIARTVNQASHMKRLDPVTGDPRFYIMWNMGEKEYRTMVDTLNRWWPLKWTEDAAKLSSATDRPPPTSM